MFAIFASIKIKSDQRENFLTSIEENAKLSVRDEPGCLRFDVFRDDEDEDRYLLYEVFTDERAWQAHIETPHAQRTMKGSNEWGMKGSKEWGETLFEVTRATSIFPADPMSFETAVPS